MVKKKITNSENTSSTPNIRFTGGRLALNSLSEMYPYATQPAKPAIVFNPKELITVLAKSPKIEVAKESKALVILAKAPIASMTTPNTIAQITR